jgi:hypothetical protein
MTLRETSRAGALRSEQLMAKLTPELSARVSAYARANQWTRSTAAAVLLERALDQVDRESRSELVAG